MVIGFFWVFFFLPLLSATLQSQSRAETAAKGPLPLLVSLPAKTALGGWLSAPAGAARRWAALGGRAGPRGSRGASAPLLAPPLSHAPTPALQLRTIGCSFGSRVARESARARGGPP